MAKPGRPERGRMTEQGIPQPAPPQPWLRHVGLIVLLLALVGTLRAAIVARTVVPARDTIGYIRYALELERFATDGERGLWDAWQTVLKRHHQHPGYPLTILAVSLPVRAWSDASDVEQMQLSAQLASNLAAVLLVIPMFLLGTALLDRRIAFWGTLLFHVLPVSA